MTDGTTSRPKRSEILNYCYLFVSEEAQGKANAVILPDAVTSAAKLARGSAVVVDEVNTSTWPAFDIRPLMDAPGYVTGRLSPRIFSKVVANLLSRDYHSVNRD